MRLAPKLYGELRLDGVIERRGSVVGSFVLGPRVDLPLIIAVIFEVVMRLTGIFTIRDLTWLDRDEVEVLRCKLGAPFERPIDNIPSLLCG